MKRIFFVIPIGYFPGSTGGFWTRDSGLVVLTLRKMGYEAWLVALGDSSLSLDGEPVKCVSLAELESSAWWKTQQPDAVVLNTWSAPRYDAIRRAALTATPRVVERLDTDGIRSARLFPSRYFIRTYGGLLDTLSARWRWLALPLAAVRFALFYLFPSCMDRRMAATMQQVSGLIAETPIAGERIQRMIETFGGTRHRIGVIPHPVNDEVIRYQDVPKEKRVITVGRWATFQKDFSMLRKVLKKFLERHPDWQATVVGSGIPSRYLLRTSAAEEWENRITCHEHLAHEQLMAEYSRSKIYLMVSRYESFCIAAAEALCCGCSVVGSVEVPSSIYFAETESGTVATARTPEAFLEALDQEVALWTQGKRDAPAIASIWRERVGCRTVTQATLEFFSGNSL